MVQCDMQGPIQLEKQPRRQKCNAVKLDYSALQQAEVRESFTEQFRMHMGKMSIPRNADEALLDINGSIRQAAKDTLPQKPIHQKKPWISGKTLAMIEERNDYRVKNDGTNERRLNRLIKQQVKLDRYQWLDNLLEDGN